MNRSHRSVFVPGLVVILCVASGYTEVFGKIKAAPPADKRKDKTCEGLWLRLLVSATVPKLLCPLTTEGGDLLEPAMPVFRRMGQAQGQKQIPLMDGDRKGYSTPFAFGCHVF